MNSTEYKNRELASFLGQKHAYFDSVRDFAERLDGMDIDEQIAWIENGSYGAGACLALKMAVESITPRCNKRARIGNVILHAFFGKPFRGWHKLPPGIQDKLNRACDSFLAREHNFAI